MHIILVAISALALVACTTDAESGSRPDLTDGDAAGPNDTADPSGDDGETADDTVTIDDDGSPPVDDVSADAELPPPDAEPTTNLPPSPDEGPPICAPALAACGGGGGEACCAGSACVGNQCLEAGGAAGRCTDPARDTCGCGAAWDDCTTPGTTCLAAGCDYEGLCVTPQEMADICADPNAAGCFQCPWCGDQLCTDVPSPQCEGEAAVKTWTQEWLGCGEGDTCQFAFSVTPCPDGQACSDGVCVEDWSCGPVDDALTGAWQWVGATATVPGYGEVEAFGVDCAATGVDQNLNPLTITHDGTFSGTLVTDYPDVWSGCLAQHPDGGHAMVVESCQVTCYDTDVEPGKLGVIHVQDGQLVIRRIGPVVIDKDGVDCQACATCGGPALDYVGSSTILFVYDKM